MMSRTKILNRRRIKGRVTRRKERSARRTRRRSKRMKKKHLLLGPDHLMWRRSRRLLRMKYQSLNFMLTRMRQRMKESRIIKWADTTQCISVRD